MKFLDIKKGVLAIESLSTTAQDFSQWILTFHLLSNGRVSKILDIKKGILTLEKLVNHCTGLLSVDQKNKNHN
jgi:hypothetical protein